MNSGNSGKKLFGCSIIFGILILIVGFIAIVINQIRLNQTPKGNTKIAQYESNKNRSKNKQAIKGKSIERMLAELDEGSTAGIDDVKVNRFRYLLKRLKEKSGEEEKRIADMTVVAQNKLKEYGIEESLLNIMEGMNRIYYSKIEGQKFAENISAYVIIRADGLSHEDAVLDLIALLKALGIE